MKKIELLILQKEDIENLAPIMKKAFDFDAQLYLGKNDGPEGYDNGGFLMQWALNQDSDSYTIWEDGDMIGSVILWINTETNQNFLGNIYIDVDKHSKGYGKVIWEMIERMYPDTKVWRTETPGYSRKTIISMLKNVDFILCTLIILWISINHAIILKKI